LAFIGGLGWIRTTDQPGYEPEALTN